MELDFVDERLKDLKPPTFRCLVPDTSFYTMLILQPREDVEGNEHVRNANFKSAFGKHKAFLELAKQKDVDLVVTPEYSCPWSVIEWCLSEKKLPAEGQLWLVGCEGILPTQLREMKAKHKEAKWITQEMAHLDQHGTYLDPLCYLFTARATNGEPRPVVVVQFKGQEMSDHEKRYEPDNLITGAERYVLRNDENSVYLTALICSDTLNSLIEKEKWYTDLYHPWLIVHPQLCMWPRDDDYTDYRLHAFRHDLESKEFLIVNWARGFRIPSRSWTSDFGCSTYYTKAPQADLSDDRLDTNHRRGLHYAWCSDHRTHMYVFNYDEHAFLLKTCKASQKIVKGSGQRNGRVGPLMTACYDWDKARQEWIANEDVDDGFSALCLQCKFDSAGLDALNVVDKERFIALSSGDIEAPATSTENWYDVRHLPSFQARDNEILNRIVFGHDPDPQAKKRRELQLRRLKDLATFVVTKPDIFPACISNLAGNSQLKYCCQVGEYDHNIYSHDLSISATGAYLGDATEGRARSAFTTMKEAVKDPTRLVVWYNSPTGIIPVTHHEPPSCTVALENRDSIAKEYDG